MGILSRTTCGADAAALRSGTRTARRRAAAGIAAGLFLAALPAAANNNVLLGMVLLDEAPAPLVYDVQAEIRLDDVPGVSSVVVSVGGSDYPAELDDGIWNAEGLQFATFTALQQALHGTWTITIAGTQPSVSTFDLDANGLDAGDFLDPPSMLDPGEGAIDVAPDTLLQWTPPAGATGAFVLVVRAEGPTTDQEAFSLEETIEIDASEWQPPELLEAGASEFSVFYVNAAPDNITNLVVGSGSITWGNNDFAPESYPEPRPLLALASETGIDFGVSVLEDFEDYPFQNDTLGVVVPAEGTFYFVRDMGAPVASVGEALASSTGVGDDGGNRYWTLGTSAGMTGSIGGTEGFLLIGDLPSLDESVAGAGIFDAYFSAPRPFFDLEVSALVRQDSGDGTAQMRFLLDDGSNEIATEKVPVGPSFSRIRAHTNAFTELVESASFDFQQVERVSIEFFLDPIPGGSELAAEFVFGVDDVRLPEPVGVVPSLAVVAVLAAAARRRRGR